MEFLKQKIIFLAKRQILFLPHAIKQMSHPARMITADEIRETILSGEIIEEYPDDPRGKSYLICYKLNNRTIHVVCAPKKEVEYLAIITAYIPDPMQWLSSFKVRR